MTSRSSMGMSSWHAHVYFDERSVGDARELLQKVAEAFGDQVSIGRMFMGPVGPHPSPSAQIGFWPQTFDKLIPWLALHHGSLDVFIHPNTEDELRDHRDHALWIGKSYALNLSILRPAMG